jgi:peptidoglycan/LPS O-acetylase OafA/YrhL
VILLPVLGLLAGFAIARREALVVTAVAAAIGFTLVAILTDEISGWLDAFVWVDTIVALLATLLGIQGRRWYRSRRRRASAS